MATTATYTVIFPKDPCYVPETPSTESTGFEADLGRLTPSEAIKQAAEKMELEWHLSACWRADYLAANPEKALKTAKNHIRKFVCRQGGS